MRHPCTTFLAPGGANAGLRSFRCRRRAPARTAAAALMLILAIGWVTGDVASAVAETVAADTTASHAAARSASADTAATQGAVPAVFTDTTAAGRSAVAGTTANDGNTPPAIAVVVNATQEAPATGPGPASFQELRNRLARARHIRLQTAYRTYDLWQLELSRDSVRFRIAGEDLEDTPRVLAWRDVYGIQVHGNQRGTGAKVGAIAVGTGCVVLLASVAASSGWQFSWTDGWAPVLISGALILTLAGALTGAITGSFVSKWENVYP